MLRIPGTWIWDSWTADDGPDHHLFFLQAPRAGHPDDRHTRATIGHAVTTDYEHWTVLPHVLRPAPAPAWDDLATWTGSVVRGPDQTWHLFYSALSRRENGRVQRIGRADSPDLISWTRFGSQPLVQADARWYETLAPGAQHEEAWRDPFVVPDPGGDGWHMLITARSSEGASRDRGVIGHAWSADLDSWEVRPPLTPPSGFGQLEVPSVVSVNGCWMLLFCCLRADLNPVRQKSILRSGMWSAPAESPIGPFDLGRARPFDDSSVYAAHLVRLENGDTGLLGFRYPTTGPFPGEIPPPVKVYVNPEGVLQQ